MSAVVDDTPLSQSATVDKEAVQPFPRSEKIYVDGSSFRYKSANAKNLSD